MNGLTLQSAIDFIFSIFGNRFKGYRTKIIAVLQIILGVTTFLSNEFAVFLCKTFHIACDLESMKWFASYATIIGLISYVLRKFTDTPDGDNVQFLKRFTGDYKQEVQKLRKAN